MLLIWTEAHIALAVTVLLGAVTAVAILRQRRSPQSAMAWLILLFVLPWLTIPAFLAFGVRRRRQRSRPAALHRPEGVGDIHRMLHAYGMPAPTEGNSFRLLPGTVEARDSLFAVIEGAERRLDVALYALEADDTGRALVGALVRAAERGVKVRLHLDALGAFFRPRRSLRRLKRAGAEVRLFAPLIHGPLGAPVNLRNHRKIVLADGGRLWSGGRNVGAHYLGPEEPVWTDLSYHAEGPLAAEMGALFESTWSGAERIGPASGSGGSCLQLLPSGADQPGDALHDLLVHLLHRAERQICIATPYFLPSSALGEALAIALRRGVEVRLLIPAESNQWLADLARGPYLTDLVKEGADLRLYPRMLHAKAVIVDDVALTGSANFDARSLLLNYEAMILLWSAGDRQALEDWFGGLADSVAPGLPQRGALRRGAEALLRLAAPIL